MKSQWKALQFERDSKGKVKKVIIHLPKYGTMEGVPKK